MVLRRKMTYAVAIITMVVLALMIVMSSSSAYAKSYTIPDGQEWSKLNASQLQPGDVLALAGEAYGKLVVPDTVKSLTIRQSSTAAEYDWIYWYGQIEMKASDATLTINNIPFENMEILYLQEEQNEKEIEQYLSQHDKEPCVFFSAATGKSTINLMGDITLSTGLGNYAIESAADLNINISNGYVDISGVSTGGDLAIILAKNSMAGFSLCDLLEHNTINCLGNFAIDVPNSAELYISGNDLLGNDGEVLYCVGNIDANINGNLYVEAGAKLAADGLSVTGGTAIICDGTFTITGSPEHFWSMVNGSYTDANINSIDKAVPVSGGLAIQMTNGVNKFVNDTTNTKMRGRINKSPDVEIAPTNEEFESYAVRLDAQGGTPAKFYLDPGADDKVIRPADPTRKGFIFKGWYSDKGCTKLYDFSQAAVDRTTVYAKWTIDPATLPPVGSIKFKDLKKDWSYDGIMYMAENNYMNGTKENIFSPNSTLTRGMLATILWRIDGLPIRTFFGLNFNSFNDVKNNKYYYNAVNWAADNGVVNGVSSWKFAPETFITREQLATMIYRYAQITGQDISASHNLSSFKDSGKVSKYAKDAMKWAVGAGIIKGDNDKLKPQGKATRAEAASMMCRFCEL